MKRMTRILNFAVIQMSMAVENKTKNIAKAENLVDCAVNDYGADVIGLPEFFNTEYFPQRQDQKYFDYAETIPGPTIDRISRKAREHGVHIFAPIYELARGGVYYDTSVLIDQKGKIAGMYRKVTAPMLSWPEAGEISYEGYYFRTGSDFPIFSVKHGKIGQLICYDRHYPEHWRVLALKGAELIFLPLASCSLKANKRNPFWRFYPIETQAFAFCNQCFVASVNRVGVEGEMKFYGGSHIVGPDGKFLAGPASDTKETILCAEIDLEKVTEIRRKLPFFTGRRPELYGTICESRESTDATRWT